jgi:hypothetical protein
MMHGLQSRKNIHSKRSFQQTASQADILPGDHCTNTEAYLRVRTCRYRVFSFVIINAAYQHSYPS